MEDRYIFMVNRHADDYIHRPLRVLWIASLENAKKICSHPKTCEQNTFLAFTDGSSPEFKYEFVPDDGRFDDVIKALGLRKTENGRRLI